MEGEITSPTEKRSLDTLIIHPALEPGVIDNAMIITSILSYGPQEEAGRLFAEEGVHLEEATIVRLEFKNILRIDHLWMLRNLTKLTLAHNLIEKIENLEQLTNLNELDLSFNKIEKIENIETLVNLEVFTVFHNMIRKFENMEALEKLLVFSIGDNLIEDYKEVAYLRQFRFLRAVSFKGNPCCDDPNTDMFIAAGLPRVTFIDYKLVSEDFRAKGQNIFRNLLRQLDDRDNLKEKQRVAKVEYDEQVVFYALSFVEYLSGPELINTMFEKDVDGTILLSFGGELIPHFEKYRDHYVEIMAGLVEFAQDAYTDRENEIKLFKDLVDNALAESVKKSKAVVDEYELKKRSLMGQLTAVIAKFTEKKASLEELEPKLTELGDEYNDAVYEVWKALMTYELQLYEQCEESRGQFKVNMGDKISKLQEVARNAFGAWREHEGLWSMLQFDIISRYLLSTGIAPPVMYDPAPELLDALKDRDVLMNLVAQSSDNHMRFIDIREDVLSTRSNEWLEDMVEGATEREIKRNRNRIMEINFYVDNQRIEWQDLQMTLGDTVDPETAALLGDDF